MIRHESPDVNVRISPEGMRRQEAAPTAQVIDIEPFLIASYNRQFNREQMAAHAARLLHEAYL